MNGFQEGFSESVSFAILDLLFLLGSGTQTATISEPEPVNIGDDHPLCRTSQLLICIALAMLRQFIYTQKIEKAQTSTGGEYAAKAPINEVKMEKFEQQLS